METTTDNRSLWLTYFTDKKTEKITRQHGFFLPLLAKMDCKNYSASVQCLIVVLVAFSPETPPEPEKMRHRKAKNEIEIRVNVDCGALLQADENKTRRLIARAYLSAISRFLSKIKDFDHLKFYADAERVFRESGVLE